MSYVPQTAQDEQDEILASKMPLPRPQPSEFETAEEYKEALAFWTRVAEA